jgi:ribonuclease HII
MLLVRHKADDIVEAGLDEAGRGSFWGPIMASAVIWPKEEEWTDQHRDLAKHIKDSKKIAAKKRETICDKIKELAVGWGVGSVTATEIDENGIQWANQEAFRRALAAITLKQQPMRLLIDGVIGMPDTMEGREQYNIIDGDALYMPIAAASILAKVEHDRWVQTYCVENPECAERYHLLSCKGYGTAKHREGLGIYGAHMLHRRTFVRKYVPESSTPAGGAGVAVSRPTICKIKIKS